MKHQFRSALFLLLLALAACSRPTPPPTGEPVAAAPQPAATAPAAAPYPATPDPATTPEVPVPTVTLQQLMRDMIDPNAQRLWRSVSYVATEGGVQETMPVSEMDWDGLRQSAVALLEASYGLTVDGRAVADADYDTTRQAFQYTAQEIAQHRAGNRADWNSISLGMRDLVQDTLDAIQRRDIFALTETGAAINQACEACHASYWYHP